MSGIFKKALSLFVEVDDSPKQDGQRNTQAFTQAATTSTPSYRTSVATDSEDMDKFEKHFEKLMADNNLPGPDYYEFAKMMETLEKSVPDDNTRMQAVFATLAVQGLTKEKLVATAGMYQKMLDNDKAQFESALNNKTEADVNQKEQQIKDLDVSIQQNTATIQQLTKQINDAHAQIASIKQDLEGQKSKLESNKNSYYFASDAMQKKISLDIQKILKNIQ